MSDSVYDLNKGWDSLAAEMLYVYMDNGVPATELAFYERRIRANGGPALDIACGTGRHLFPLLARGLVVHGTDASAGALRFARIKATQVHQQPQLYHQRMEDFDVPHKYSTMYIPNGSFQIICDHKIALVTLRKFRQHLHPKGQLLVELVIPEEVTNPALIQADTPRHSWGPKKRKHASGEITTTVWTESIDLFEQILVEKRSYDILVDGQIVNSELHTLSWTYYFKNEFVMMLENAGFNNIYLYSDYTEQPATKDSKTVVYGAHNPN